MDQADANRATSDSSSPRISAATDPLSSAKENLKPMNERIHELHESRAELMNRLQSLKQDLHNWRYKLDTQVKIYSEELLELKNSLDVEVEELRSEFQGLRTTIQKQQEDLTSSLRSLGLQDAFGNEKRAGEHSVKEEDAQADSLIVERHAAKVSKTDGHNTEAEACPANHDEDAET